MGLAREVRNLQVGAPLPKHQGHLVGNLCRASSVPGTHLAIPGPGGVDFSMITVAECLFVNSWSPSWALVYLNHDG